MIKILKFKNLKSYVEFVKYNNRCLDIVKIGDIVYTQQEYDSKGKYITYGNKRLCKGFQLNTEDRYNKGFNDVEVEEFDDWYLRNDIEYFD